METSDAAGPPIDFETVICGVDPSRQSTEAARQARAVAGDGAKLWAVSAWDPGEAIHAGIHSGQVRGDLRDDSTRALRQASDAVPGIQEMQFEGPPVASLLAAASNLDADLIAVGASGSARAAGILFGFVATAMAHHAPCSVLISRPSSDAFLGRILHAGDGSPESLDAARFAGRIASRSGASVATLHVRNGETDAAAVAAESAALAEAPDVEAVTMEQEGRPQRRICEEASEMGASLIVIGSRGMTGVNALGSVSESVAHRAPCSVLIVRRTAHPASA